MGMSSGFPLTRMYFVHLSALAHRYATHQNSQLCIVKHRVELVAGFEAMLVITSRLVVMKLSRYYLNTPFNINLIMTTHLESLHNLLETPSSMCMRSSMCIACSHQLPCAAFFPTLFLCKPKASRPNDFQGILHSPHQCLPSHFIITSLVVLPTYCCALCSFLHYLFSSSRWHAWGPFTLTTEGPSSQP